MRYEDLSFNMRNEEGLEVICDITTVIPNPINTEEPYVKYTDYMLDENDEFRVMYGKIISENGEDKLLKIENKEEIAKIEELSKDEVVQYVNEQVQENIS